MLSTGRTYDVEDVGIFCPAKQKTGILNPGAPVGDFLSTISDSV